MFSLTAEHISALADHISALPTEVFTLDQQLLSRRLKLSEEDVSQFHTWATPNIELWKAVEKNMIDTPIFVIARFGIVNCIGQTATLCMTEREEPFKNNNRLT